MGKTFKLWADCLSLNYLFDQPNLNAQQARWLEFLCEFEFDFKHVKGKEDKVVDALSRKFHMVAVSTDIFKIFLWHFVLMIFIFPLSPW